MRICLSQIKHFFLKDRSIHVHILIIVNIVLAGIAFIKDILLANYFGTSRLADILYFAFFIPDTVGNSLLASAIGISCIPIFTKILTNKKSVENQQSISKIIIVTILISSCFMLFLLPSAKWIFTQLHLEMALGANDISYYYFLIMLPIVILSPLALIATSILQVLGHFTKPALMPVVLNLILTFAILICIMGDFPLLQGGYLYSSALFISALIITVLLWAMVFDTKSISLAYMKKPFTVFKQPNEDIHLFFKIFIPYFIVILFQQIVFLFERFFASTIGPGTISGLTYAYRISQFPIWVFIAAINTVLLPTISKLKEDENKLTLKKELVQSFQFIVIISFIVSLLFYFLGEHLISLIFLQGAFDKESLRITSDIFSGYSLSIFGQSIYLFCLRYFIAYEKMKIPLLSTLFGCLVQISLMYIFIPTIGAKGIGYAAAIGYTFTGVMILFYSYRDFSIGEKKGGR